jgi:hypothetical protein
MKAPLLFLAAAALLPAVLRADHEDFVTINANASPDYAHRKSAHGAPARETYVFYQGRFFGETNDPTLQRLSFLDIARILAPDLAKQNYFPTKDAKNADLVIVVNWGSTLTDPSQDPNDTERQFQFEDKMKAIQDYNASFAAGGGPDPADIQFQMTIARGDQFAAQVAASYNARILGYTTILNKELAHSWAYSDGLSAKAESYLADLNQERYFVVLLAYDYQELQRAHRSNVQAAIMGGAAYAAASTTSLQREGTAARPVWSVRMNIRAAGNNFATALPAMADLASDYFGKQLDDLATARASVGSRAHVDVGEARVVGDAR